MNVLVLMAGDSKRFEDSGHTYPKNLVEIDGLPLAQRVIDSLRTLIEAGARLVCVIRGSEAAAFHTDEVLRLLAPDATIVVVPDLQSGAACSALLAIEQVDAEAPLLIFNGDQVLDLDLAEATASFRTRDLDAGVVVFQAVHPRWSYVRIGEAGLVVEAAEKRPISTLATAGTYYFRRSADFFEAAMAMIRKDAHVQGRFFVCPTFNEMILGQARIGVFEIDRSAYHSLATPQGVAAYDECLQARRTAI